ncbi:hypothetical protein [Bacillus halotolerans]|uniref:hypothetical protein n=1 Tax=Bacillus halotolerans TaxID=260554 RepID=UPI002DB5C9FF|nr:hypothetical protein [Bacillus halotolerans]MEC1662183.1 hypothetical protein [Bacillus halotolerans]
MNQGYSTVSPIWEDSSFNLLTGQLCLSCWPGSGVFIFVTVLTALPESLPES